MSISLNKAVTHIVSTSGTCVLTLSDVDGILIGSTVDVQGFMTQSWNALNASVTAVDTTNLTITIHNDNLTITAQDCVANVHLHVHWVDNAYVETMIGFTPTGDELAYLTADVDAANDWAYRKRAEAGYNPHPGYCDGHDVKMGTGLYAMMLYRERGTSGDNYASYGSMGQFERPVSLGRIMQLLGCGRAQVA